MKTSRRWIALLLPVLTLALASLACAVGTPSVTVDNQSSFEICYFDISPDAEGEWGENELGDETIAPGEKFTVENVEAGTYDFRAEACDETMEPVEQHDVEIDGPFTWELSDQ